MQLQITAQFTPIARDWKRGIEKAGAVALTRTAWKVKDGLEAGMRDSFDRPTPFTMRAFRVEMAKASTLEAVVYAMPLQARYLRREIEGGARASKGFERKMQMFGGQVALPAAGAKLDGYGNMSLSFIKRVAKDRNSSGDQRRFFVGKPKGGAGRPDGVWARVDGNRRIVPVMMFASQARYKSRLDTSAIAGRVVDVVFESQIMRAMQQFGG